MILCETKKTYALCIILIVGIDCWLCLSNHAKMHARVDVPRIGNIATIINSTIDTSHRSWVWGMMKESYRVYSEYLTCEVLSHWYSVSRNNKNKLKECDR